MVAIRGQSGAGMLNDWAPLARITPAYEPRMSDNARRVLVLRNWVDDLEQNPRSSPWYDAQLYECGARLRDQAAYVIGHGC